MSDYGALWIGNDHGGVRTEIADSGAPGEERHRGARRRVPFHRNRPLSSLRGSGEAVLRGEASRGILICSTGIGMSIIANRFAGVRASLCTSTYMGRMTRAHNDSNVLCLGGKITGVFEAIDILDTWLATPYEGQPPRYFAGLDPRSGTRFGRMRRVVSRP